MYQTVLDPHDGSYPLHAFSIMKLFSTKGRKKSAFEAAFTLEVVSVL